MVLNVVKEMDVLVVRAGSTGLALAVDLARRVTVDPKPLLVADIRLDGIGREHTHTWDHPDGATVMYPLAGTDTFRFGALFHDPQARPDTTADGVRKLIAARPVPT
jgi:hypothetical protein